jgi:hypothetical protein
MTKTAFPAHPMGMRHAIRATCKVKDNRVNELVAVNSRLNTLSPSLLRSERGRAEVQERRESLYLEIKLHRKKGHGGKPYLRSNTSGWVQDARSLLTLSSHPLAPA